MSRKQGKKWLFIVVGSILFAILLFNSTSRKIVSIYLESRHMSSEIERLTTENQLLRNELEVASKDSDYQEFLARKELDLISNGEVQYYFGKGKAKKDEGK